MFGLREGVAIVLDSSVMKLRIRQHFWYALRRQTTKSGTPTTNAKKHIKKSKVSFSGLALQDCYAYLCASIVPRPIAFVSSISKSGIPNLAPLSFFMPVASDPTTLAFSLTRKRDDSMKDTLTNILEVEHFVVNHLTEDIFEQAYEASHEYDTSVDEFKVVGLTPVSCDHGPAPSVGESQISLECRLWCTTEIGNGKYGGSDIVVGQILAAYVKEEHLQDGLLVPQNLRTVSRLGAMDYGGAEVKFTKADDNVWSYNHW